ncbi:MAG: twin-arginine translocation pathway signal protein [Betaproteobacteria bacterium HGW-Betaproteobacteria-11]|nr:MAG: twin-arginine translocation pathway signal protein [Betaproteobacteria bacterium HGW-Betaproteobacteria-11]
MIKPSRWFALLAATLLLPAAAAFAAELQAGRDYTPVEPPLYASKGKIEVVEFFSYACPHCNEFHPLLDAWAAKLPKDVVLRRVPITFHRLPWERLSRIYYALDALGEAERLSGAVFKAIHEERANFNSDEAVVAWAVKNGLDGKKFGDVLASFSVQSKVAQADQESGRARIQGVPALVVDGRWLLVNQAAGTNAELIKRVDQLIDKARKEKKGR